jgi:sorbitol-specific phosphotransferase system component IIC
MQTYGHHNARVRQVIPLQRLLEFHPKEGWKSLYAFLEKPIPSTSFPHVNSSADVWHGMYGNLFSFTMEDLLALWYSSFGQPSGLSEGLIVSVSTIMLHKRSGSAHDTTDSA